MGSFSWKIAGNNHGVVNMYHGRPVKILIPEQFGGGYVAGIYDDYGSFFSDTEKEIDVYEWLAAWNVTAKDLTVNLDDIGVPGYLPSHVANSGSSIYSLEIEALSWVESVQKQKEYFVNLPHKLPTVSDATPKVRSLGISMGCYDSEHACVDFPLKFVDFRENISYEELGGLSLQDPYQGCGVTLTREASTEEAIAIAKEQGFYDDYECEEDIANEAPYIIGKEMDAKILTEWNIWRKSNPQSTNPYFVL